MSKFKLEDSGANKHKSSISNVKTNKYKKNFIKKPSIADSLTELKFPSDAMAWKNLLEERSVIAEAQKSAVNIRPMYFYDKKNERGEGGSSNGESSGVILNKDGYILVSGHAFKESYIPKQKHTM